jgi:serine/threonine-protein kinase
LQPVAGYRPFAELARGAAVVYKAYDPRRRRTVLLKVLTPEAADDPALVAWFEGEARAVAEVEHENVVALYEAGRDGARPYLVTEFVEGRSLAEVLADGPLPADLAAYVAASAARGLSAAHERGLLHRDVKPGNVLLASDGQVKLADFGLATRADAADGQGSDVRGTPGYLAPEVIRGSPPGPASDLFALGAVLVEAVTGRPAFPSAGAAHSLDVALHHDPVPGLRSDPRVPAPLAEIAARLLEKDAAGRPASARAAAEALDALRGQGAGRVGASALAAFLDDPAAYRASHPAPAGPAVQVPAERLRHVHPLRRARTLIAGGLLAVALTTVLIVRGAREEPATVDPAPAEIAGGVTIEPAPVDDTIAGMGAPAGDPAAAAATPPDDEPAPVIEAPVPAAPGEPEPERPPDAAPAERPAPPEPTGQLTVAVEPWAEVFVDGRAVGTTPLGAPLALSAGAHSVMLRNPEFPEHVARVVVPAGGSERLAVSLWSLVARISVEVSPWAEVSVDGRAVGTTPLRRPLVLSPGTHTLRLVHPTLGEREERITVDAGESRTVRIRMGA